MLQQVPCGDDTTAATQTSDIRLFLMVSQSPMNFMSTDQRNINVCTNKLPYINHRHIKTKNWACDRWRPTADFYFKHFVEYDITTLNNCTWLEVSKRGGKEREDIWGTQSQSNVSNLVDEIIIFIALSFPPFLPWHQNGPHNRVKNLSKWNYPQNLLVMLEWQLSVAGTREK